MPKNVNQPTAVLQRIPGGITRPRSVTWKLLAIPEGPVLEKPAAVLLAGSSCCGGGGGKPRGRKLGDGKICLHAIRFLKIDTSHTVSPNANGDGDAGFGRCPPPLKSNYWLRFHCPQCPLPSGPLAEKLKASQAFSGPGDKQTADSSGLLLKPELSLQETSTWAFPAHQQLVELVSPHRPIHKAGAQCCPDFEGRDGPRDGTSVTSMGDYYVQGSCWAGTQKSSRLGFTLTFDVGHWPVDAGVWYHGGYCAY